MSNPLKASAPKVPDMSVSLNVEKGPAMKQMRQEKNEMLSNYFKSKKNLNAWISTLSVYIK